MNSENTDAAAEVQSPAPARKRRGWWSRNRLWFVPVVLAALIVFGAGWAYWSMYGRVYCLDEYCKVTEKIEANEKIKAALGEPIDISGWRPPSSRLEEHEREVRWDIAGPKGAAKVHLLAKLMRGKWEICVCEITLSNGDKISLADEFGGSDDAQEWKPEATSNNKKPETDAPPPEINLPTPDFQVPEGL